MRFHDLKIHSLLILFMFLYIPVSFSETSLQFFSPPKNIFSSQGEYETKVDSWADGVKFFSEITFLWKNGPYDLVQLSITKSEKNYENPSEIFQPFFDEKLSGADDAINFQSFTGLQLGDVNMQGDDQVFTTITESSKILTDRGGRRCTMGPDGKLISLPYDPSEDFGDCIFIFKNFFIRLVAYGPETNNRLTAFDSLLLQTKSRITIFRADEEASELLTVFQGPPGIRKSLEVKIENFKKACMDSDFKRAQNMLDALRNELKAQRGKQVSESFYQALSRCAGEFEASVRFLMNPVLPPPPVATPTGGQN